MSFVLPFLLVRVADFLCVSWWIGRLGTREDLETVATIIEWKLRVFARIREAKSRLFKRFVVFFLDHVGQNQVSALRVAQSDCED